MARWSKAVEGSVFHVEKAGLKGNFLQQYFESEAYIPQTEEDKKELEDFSFIISVMSLLVHLAKADGIIKQEERDQIIDELVYQLEQRYYEYESLTEEFGDSDKEIVANIFTKIVDEYEENVLQLDETINIIKKIYQFNPYKLKFIIRLCYTVALSDQVLSISEQEVIKDFADAFGIPEIELERLKSEAKQQVRK